MYKFLIIDSRKEEKKSYLKIENWREHLSKRK